MSSTPNVKFERDVQLLGNAPQSSVVRVVWDGLVLQLTIETVGLVEQE
jgi:hypothetical protein